MGRHNAHRHSPQRSHLPADKETRNTRVSQAFSMYRPAGPEASEEIYERLRLLQREEDIPADVTLDQNHHSSIIQERRMRKGLAKGFAGGFALATALGHLQSGIPGHGLGTVQASISDVDVIGRNRNIIIGRLTDTHGELATQARVAHHILGELGLKLNVDRRTHVRLGESKSGLTQTERKHVIHTIADTIADIQLELLPIIVEYKGQQVPLCNAKQIEAPMEMPNDY